VKIEAPGKRRSKMSSQDYFQNWREFRQRASTAMAIVYPAPKIFSALLLCPLIRWK